MKHSEIQVEITRGGIVESRHQVSAIIVDSKGHISESWGDIESPVYPRSSIKAMQVMAFIEAGGHEKFGFTQEEIAICCASHNGEPKHHQTVTNMLKKIGLAEPDFECGSHWPMRVETGYELAASGHKPDQCHNNCSGKHAGMLGLAKILGSPHQGYIEVDHPVQKKIAETMAEMCDIDYQQLSWSPDGCSAPTWAMPLYNLGLAFARLADPSSLPPSRQLACETIYQAVVAHPFMVAGTQRYCTQMMEVFGDKVFLKTGAEGVYIAAIPSKKLAIALKCSDGGTRAAEIAMTHLLDHAGITQGIDSKLLAPFQRPEIKNWNKRLTGHILCHLD